MDVPGEKPGLPLRIGGALVGLGLAAFFGALGILVLRNPFEPGTPWWAEWSIRVFGVLIFGSLAGLGVYVFVMSLRGPREPPLPHPLLTRCGACGERILPTTSTCPGCGRAPGQVGRAWQETPREGAGGMLLAAGIAGGMGGGVFSLGVFIGGSALFGKEGALLRLAYAGLGLLLVVVGGGMLYGGLAAFREAFRERGRRSFTLYLGLDGADIAARADFDIGSTSLRGTTLTRHPLDAAPDPGPHDPVVHPSHRALVRTLAVLHARGVASLALVETLHWAAGDDDDEPSRVTGVDVEASTDAPRVDVPVDARHHVLRALSEGVTPRTLRSLAGTLVEDRDLRRAFEAYASRLSADEVDPRTARILASVLEGGAGPAPYRQAGAL